jgi:hypothetical protein
MRKNKFPSLQFINRDRMSLLFTLPPNGRSMPLNQVFTSLHLKFPVHCRTASGQFLIKRKM